MMGHQVVNMTSKEMMNDMLKRHYQEARDAKANGQLVCWSTSIAP